MRTDCCASTVGPHLQNFFLSLHLSGSALVMEKDKFPQLALSQAGGQFYLHWYQQCQFKSSHSVELLCWTRQEEQTFYNIVFTVMIKRRYQGMIPWDFSIALVIFLLFKFPSQFSSHPFALSQAPLLLYHAGVCSVSMRERSIKRNGAYNEISLF